MASQWISMLMLYLVAVNIICVIENYGTFFYLYVWLNMGIYCMKVCLKLSFLKDVSLSIIRWNSR